MSRWFRCNYCGGRDGYDCQGDPTPGTCWRINQSTEEIMSYNILNMLFDDRSTRADIDRRWWLASW